MKARWLVIVAAALLLAGACADSPTEESDGGGSGSQDEKTGYEDVLSEIEGLTGKARTDKLVELAGEEGGILNVYTSMTSDVEDAVAGAFGDDYYRNRRRTSRGPTSPRPTALSSSSSITKACLPRTNQSTRTGSSRAPRTRGGRPTAST